MSQTSLPILGPAWHRTVTLFTIRITLREDLRCICAWTGLNLFPEIGFKKTREKNLLDNVSSASCWNCSQSWQLYSSKLLSLLPKPCSSLPKMLCSFLDYLGILSICSISSSFPEKKSPLSPYLPDPGQFFINPPPSTPFLSDFIFLYSSILWITYLTLSMVLLCTITHHFVDNWPVHLFRS